MGVEPTNSGLAILRSRHATLLSLTRTGFEPMKLTQRIYNPSLLTTQASSPSTEAKGIEPLF